MNETNTFNAINALVSFNKVSLSSYRLSIVTMSLSICRGLAAILNAKLLPAAITCACLITVSYPSGDCRIQCSSVTLAYMGLFSFWEIAFIADMFVV